MPVAVKRKRCAKCGEVKPANEFYLQRGKPRATCKACQRPVDAKRTRQRRDRRAALEPVPLTPEQQRAIDQDRQHERERELTYAVLRMGAMLGHAHRLGRASFDGSWSECVAILARRVEPKMIAALERLRPEFEQHHRRWSD